MHRASSPILALVGIALLASPAAAQRKGGVLRDRDSLSRQARGGSVRGAVFDSLSNSPLAGATVIVEGLSYFTTTDSAGRFRIDTLPEGRVSVSFSQPWLDSLGITLPPQAVDVRTGAVSVVGLAVPSARTLAAAVCPGGALGASSGLVMGIVRDATTDAVLPGAQVSFSWTESLVIAGSARRFPKQLAVKSEPDGTYRACGVGVGVDVDADVQAGRGASGVAALRLGPSAFARLDLLVAAPANVAAGRADSAGRPAAAATPRGTATLVGSVTNRGQPLAGAVAQLVGTTLKTHTDTGGTFRLGQLPAGTHTVEVRYIGFTPTRTAVQLRAGQTTRTAVKLDERAVVLEEVTVIGKRRRDAEGFDDRRRRGLGYFLTAEDIDRRGGVEMTDVLRGVPGLQVVPAGNGQYKVLSSRLFTSYRGCPPTLWVDGLRWMGEISEVNQMVRLPDIQGIEVYSGSEAPVRYQGSNNECGVILLWTRSTAGRAGRSDRAP